MTFSCPSCEREFADANARYQHAKAKHGRRIARSVRPQRNEEPSLGEELAQAQIAWETTREKPPEHLRLMFPEAFT